MRLFCILGNTFDDGLDLGQRLRDDGGRGHTVEIEDMTAVEELEDELEGHAVHVGHGQHGYDLVAGLDGLAQHVAGEVVVRPEGAVGDHHALREARGAAGVVDDSQFVGILLDVIVHMFLAEVLGEFLAVELVEVLAGVGELVSATHHQRVVGIVNDTFEGGHRHRVDNGGHVVAHEQQAGLGVVHDVMDLLGIELVQDGNGDGAVGECRQEGNGPLRGVAATEGYLVALLDATVLEKDVHFLDLSCHIMELKRLAFVVGQSITVPIVDDAFLYKRVETW